MTYPPRLKMDLMFFSYVILFGIWLSIWYDVHYLSTLPARIIDSIQFLIFKSLILDKKKDLKIEK